VLEVSVTKEEKRERSYLKGKATPLILVSIIPLVPSHWRDAKKAPNAMKTFL
jgi:hypothetical protein